MHLLYATDRSFDAYLVRALREVGHVVEEAADPADGLAMAGAGDYGGVILDWTAPPDDWTRRFAAAAPDALLLVISASGDEGQHTDLLKAGADACFARPLQFIEVEARLEALARLMHRKGPDPAMLELVASERSARLGGATASLPLHEYRLLEHLMAHPGEVIGVERLQQNAWGEASEPQPELVRAGVSRLRRRLRALSALPMIVTVAGHGYVFRAPENAGAAKMKISSSG